jgi:DNA-binding PadR family transcriptional regulator
LSTRRKRRTWPRGAGAASAGTAGVVVASESAPTVQACTSPLESHDHERIDPSTFDGALETLVDRGNLTGTGDGVHERDELTDAGEQRLREQCALLERRLPA